MEQQPPSVKAIFDRAAELASPAERQAYLDSACADAPEVRRKVEALLQAYDAAGSFLDKPAATLALTTDSDAGQGGALPPCPWPAPETAGSHIGPYKLLQLLGEGGMGTVFLAEQERPVKRRVALKIIKPGMDSRQVLARFEAERQALALMDHPNIAKVHEGGTTASGRPYFVMELIKGIPITKYCDREHLTPKERLELFLPVCQSIQHAHQKGIIHRDLKPSNVYIALYDGKPVPKVIDFGVAKATAHKLTERTLFTEVGQIVGTLEYMAPEQAELNNLDIDTRADIYALGVMLYELLTGGPPFTAKQLCSAAFTEMLRMIREVDPPRPSTKISSSAELVSIAAHRKLEPKKLTKLVRGELDWIVMKCLEKDRGRRYETADGLARDIERYLHDDPVQACPPSAAYRLRKFARRNRATLGTAMLVALALVAGLGMALWQASEARQSAKTARKSARDALAAKAHLEEANQELKQTRDEVEVTLARSLLRPLAQQPGPLTEPEVESLWELTGNRSEELWKRFVEQALRDPRPTRQVKTRAELALHAAVGLDPAKRLQAERLLGERMQDPALTHAQRADLALIAVALGGLTPKAQSQAAQTLIEALGKVTDPSGLQEAAQGLSTLAARTGPEEAARTCSRAANILSQTLAKTHYSGFEPLSRGLAALAARMESKEAARVCSQAAATLTQTMNANRSHSRVVDAFARSLLVRNRSRVEGDKGTEREPAPFRARIPAVISAQKAAKLT
jgi:serine/threonine protein kinase